MGDRLIARRAKSEQERNDAFKTLEAGVSRCTRLVNQLLELARNEPESAALPHGAVSLSGVVEETATQAFPLSRNKSIALTSAVDGELVVSGNATQLGVMISNLVSNAILYTPPSGNVKIWGRRDGDFAVLDIGLAANRNVEEHRNLFTAEWAFEEVFHMFAFVY